MTAFALTSALDTLQSAVGAMLDFGLDLLGRIAGARAQGVYTHIPRRFAAAPERAERRIARTVDWVFALIRTLAGDRYYLPQPKHLPLRPPSVQARMPRLGGRPPLSPAQRDLAELSRIRRAFATLPIDRIARRLARRLGIHPSSDEWPTNLLAITETPAAWQARVHRQSLPTPPTTPTPADLPPPSPCGRGQGRGDNTRPHPDTS